MQQPKNGIFSGTNYNRFNFMERPRDVQVREHRNTDAIDFFPCSVQGFACKYWKLRGLDNHDLFRLCYILLRIAVYMDIGEWY